MHYRDVPCSSTSLLTTASRSCCCLLGCYVANSHTLPSWAQHAILILSYMFHNMPHFSVHFCCEHLHLALLHAPPTHHRRPMPHPLSAIVSITTFCPLLPPFKHPLRRSLHLCTSSTQFALATCNSPILHMSLTSNTRTECLADSLRQACHTIPRLQARHVARLHMNATQSRPDSAVKVEAT